jgi:CubicO group peptidase (beta-lactamase class C family)
MMATSACGTPTLPEVGEVGSFRDGNLQAVLSNVISVGGGVPALGAFTARILPDTESDQDRLVLLVDTAVAGTRMAGSGPLVTMDDLWHFGSLTKSMTASLAARLVERGLISWDATIAQIFPELVGTIEGVYEDVRLDELLYHTSGLPSDITQTPSWPDLRTSQLPVVEQRRTWIEELLSLEPEMPRGIHVYTDAGYVVAGAMLEQVAATTWEDLIRQEIFLPLGMTTAGFGSPGTPGAIDQPRGHELAGNAWSPVEPGPEADNPAVLGPARTVHGSLSDLIAYAVEHLHGARDSSAFFELATWEKLHSAAPGTGYALGRGVDQRTWANGTVLAHSGSNTLWFAILWIAPERDMVLGAVTNAWGKTTDGTWDAERAATQAIQAMILRAGFSL